jgi:hypothetical protein
VNTPHPVRAAAIARQLLAVVESGQLDRRPTEAASTWLNRAIAELDKLRIERDPTAILDRLDELIAELSPTNQPKA